jgi:hypothetical protein
MAYATRRMPYRTLERRGRAGLMILADPSLIRLAYAQKGGGPAGARQPACI